MNDYKNYLVGWTHDELQRVLDQVRAGVILSEQDYDNMMKLATNVFSGDYRDLINKPDFEQIIGDYIVDHAILNESMVLAAILAEIDKIDFSVYATKDDLLTKSNVDHNHDSLYGSKANEHNHANKDILERINQATIDFWNKGGNIDLTPYSKTADVDKKLNTKVDKVAGMSLIANEDIAKIHDHEFNMDALNSITENKILSWDNKSEFSGQYNDLKNKPVIPTEMSDLNNDLGYLTAEDYDDIDITIDGID